MPNGVIITYTYSDNTLISGISNALTSVSYNELGLPSRRVYSSGIDTNLSYNSTNLRLSNIKTSNLQGFTYSYDNVGNVKQILDAVNSRNYTMSYDDLDRLITADFKNSSTTLWSFNYSYDSLGNILSVVSLTGTLNYYYDNKLVHAPWRVG